MYVTLSTEIEINNEPTPEHNEYVPTYELSNIAKQLFISQLIQMAINFATTKNTNEIEDFVHHMQYEVPQKPEPSWTEKANEDAKDFIKYYLEDEIIEQLIEDGEFGEDIRNDFSNGDSSFHEIIVDRSYDDKEAIDLISDLYEYEETDSGLWESLSWDQVLSAKAAWTYGNAVYEKATDIINDIREKIEMDYLDVRAAETIVSIKEDNIYKFDDMDDDEIIKYAKENYENEFNEMLKKKITKLIEEEL